MCGITGIIHLDGGGVDAVALRHMTDVARHRGPDDQGFRLFSLATGQTEAFDPARGVPPGRFTGGFGFNRLSILDLSPRGHQPMANEDGTVFIAFNGEVYNAFDHKPALEAAGHRFRSATDTEVILHLYEEHGIEGCLERLNGMFAFAIADLRRGEVHLARDHLGVKPLYHAMHGGMLLFASEAKSIMAFPGFARELDPAMLDEHLLFRYTAGEGFLAKGIRQLRPGFRMTIDRAGTVTTRRHYTVPDVPPDRAGGMERFAEALTVAVRRQLISDVKLGCQLSGGIDSSMVTSIARERFDQDLDAFSIIFDDATVSEEPWMRIAAAKTRTTLHASTLTFDYFLDHLREATWHYDAPLNLANAVGLFLLAREARRKVTVLLSGDGADELLGGYPRFFMAAIRPRVMGALPLLRHVPRLGPKLVRNFDAPPGLDRETWFIKYSSSMRDAQALALRPDADLVAPIERRRAIFREGRSTFLDDCCKYEMQTFMVELLIRQDKMMMAHSVENRVPFLDRDVVEAARRLPMPLRISGRALRSDPMERGTKVILKEMAERRFGGEFVRRRKSGFGLPLLDYFRHPRFEALLNDSLIPGIASRGWIDPRTVRDWHARIRDRRDASLTEAMWSVVSLEIWAQECLDKAPEVRTPPALRAQ